MKNQKGAITVIGEVILFFSTLLFMSTHLYSDKKEELAAAEVQINYLEGHVERQQEYFADPVKYPCAVTSDCYDD